MPKSRRRKKRKNVMDAALSAGRLPTAKEALEEQRQLFRQKFGRDWRAGDPVFFDPDKDEPTQWSEGKLTAGILEAMRKAGTPPQIIYAYRKTGRLLVEGMTQAEPAVWKEWNDAIDEYFALERKARGEGV